MSQRYISQKLLELLKVRRDMAHHILRGVADFEEASPDVKALLITRVLHPDLAQSLDRPEEFSGAELPEGRLDTTSPAAHLRIHALVLENAMENEDAASALGNLLSAAGQYHEDPSDALHVAVHVIMMIQLQQIWGAAVSGTGESGARTNQGEVALKEANTWFTKASKGRVKKLPAYLREILRYAPTHPTW